MRTLSLACLVGAVLVSLPAIAVCKDEAPVTSGQAWAIVPLELALEEPGLESAVGLVLSDGDLLVVAEPDRAEVLGGLVAPLGGEVGALGLEPVLRLWTSVGRIPDETARELGLRILHRSEAATLFQARPNSAYRLLERGFFIAEARLRPIADLKREHFGAGLTDRLLADRPMTDSRERFIAGLADAVSGDTLRSRVRFLNYDDAAQAYRSRFAPRHEVRQQITPYLTDLLTAYLVPNGGTVEVGEFTPDLSENYQGDDSVFVNVIASKAGRKTSAHYIICAHYDAIAVSDPAWVASPTAWRTIPTPGADDNATGTAVVLEAARLISSLDLDVGVKFIAFSGEELGLLGSRSYVDGLSPEDSILGVINLDMVGYQAGGKYIGVTYDRKSQWLSELLEETAGTAGLVSETASYDRSGIHNSDHASFWTAGTPAVMIADRPGAGGEPLYPYYHTLADTLGKIDIDQVSENAKLVVSFLARFAEVQEDTVCDLALTQGSVQWSWEGAPYAPLVAGDSVSASVRVVNLGGSMTGPEIYNFHVLLGSNWAGQVVAYQTVPVGILSGEYAVARASWKTSPDLFGEVMYFFALDPVNDDAEANLANNAVAVPLQVMPPALVLRDLHVFANPVTDPADANLSFEIWHPNWQGLDNNFTGRVEVWIYDLGGSRVGGGTLLRTLTGNKDIALGENSIALERLLPDGADLAPGLYICFAELKVTGEAGSATAKTKFAVAR